MKAGTGFAASGELPASAQLLPVELWNAARALWQRVRRIGQQQARRLRLCESLPLGERRFVAVLEFDQSRFLVGGTSASLVLLARLENRPPEDRRIEDRPAVPGADAEIAPEERP